MNFNIQAHCELAALASFLRCFLEFAQGYWELLGVLSEELDILEKSCTGFLRMLAYRLSRTLSKRLEIKYGLILKPVVSGRRLVSFCIVFLTRLRILAFVGNFR